MGSPRRAPISFPAPEDLTGRSVGRFLIRSKLGAGGMGEVYYADDPQLKRPVALKRVSNKLGSDPEARQHTLREAQRASALKSEHIASVYDVVEDLGELFLVMEYVEGETLRERLRRPMTLERSSRSPRNAQKLSLRHTNMASYIATSSRRTSCLPPPAR